MNDDGDEEDVMPVQDQLQPQGFRRAFIRQQARTDFAAARVPVTKTFVEFLDLYGNFMGEYLYDSDDEAIESTEDEEEREDLIQQIGGERSKRSNGRSCVLK